MAEKIYVGKGKKFGEYNQVRIGMRLEDLQKNVNEKGWVNVVVAEMREPDKFGNTHTVYVDTWKPEKKESKSDDLPF